MNELMSLDYRCAGGAHRRRVSQVPRARFNGSAGSNSLSHAHATSGHLHLGPLPLPQPLTQPHRLTSARLSSITGANEVVGIFNYDKHVVLASVRPSVTAACGGSGQIRTNSSGAIITASISFNVVTAVSNCEKCSGRPSGVENVDV